MQRDFVTGLDLPWDMGFLTDGTMFVTEKTGALKMRRPSGEVRTLFTVSDSLELMGLAVDPNYQSTTGTTGSRSLYTCAATKTNDVKVVRWRLSDEFTLVSRTDILSINWGGLYNIKNGCRIRFRPGTDELWVTTGDAHVGTNPQNLDVNAGKVLRVTRDGKAYPGNPFGTAVYTFGHRNPQGIAFQPGTNLPYATDHGPDADDEVNALVPGGNSGWDPGDPYPEGFGAGVPMTDVQKFPHAMKPAWRSGSTTIAPSGATFLSGPQWQSWDGALAVANLKGSHLRVMLLGSDGSVTSTTSALALGVRLRSAVQGPDGSLYIATDVASPGGAIWRITPGPTPDGTTVNRAPVANAGADQTVESMTDFVLDGTATDADNDGLRYEWAQLSGPSATMRTPGEARTTVGGVPGEATLVFRLTAIDSRGATGTDDVTVTVRPSVLASISDATVTEGNAGTVEASFAITLSRPANTARTVTYASTRYTATPGSDYTEKAGSVVFAPGETSKTAGITVHGDTIAEPDEAFVVRLVAVYSDVTFADGDAIGIIRNDDVPLGSISDATVTEGNAGTVEARFAITLSGPATTARTVTYASSRDSATPGSDYTEKAGSVVFAPGETSKTVGITVHGDRTREPDETFRVRLVSMYSDVSFADGDAIGLIRNDDKR